MDKKIKKIGTPSIKDAMSGNLCDSLGAEKSVIRPAIIKRDKPRILYSEKLKNPKWQKKRLEIMQRDNFKCQRCGNDDESLVVHHKEYNKGKDPWDYTSDLLITLCESCHNSFHSHDKTGKYNSLNFLKYAKVNNTDIHFIEYFSGLFLMQEENTIFDLIEFMKSKIR